MRCHKIASCKKENDRRFSIWNFASEVFVGKVGDRRTETDRYFDWMWYMTNKPAEIGETNLHETVYSASIAFHFTTYNVARLRTQPMEITIIIDQLNRFDNARFVLHMQQSWLSPSSTLPSSLHFLTLSPFDNDAVTLTKARNSQSLALPFVYYVLPLSWLRPS